MSVVLLVNPASARGRHPRLVARVATALDGPYAAPTVIRSRSLAEVTDLTAAAAPGQVVVVLGGDGTLHAAAAGAARSGAVIAPLPGGSGNDLCRHLRVPLHPVQAARAVSGWRQRPIDLGLVGDREFLTIAALGFTARINAAANRAHRRGPWIYVLAALALLLRARPEPVTLRLDGVPHDASAWLVAVAGTRCQGGGITTAPLAVVDDGVLDVMVYRARTWPGFVGTLLATLVRRQVGLPGVWRARARLVEVSSPVPLDCYADGELLATTPCRISLRPGAVRVLAPR